MVNASHPLAADMLALNNAHAEQTSRLDAPRLAGMLEAAFLVGTAGALDAFLIAFDQDAAYDSPNFLWLRARHRRFVYVDRIVTAPAARGRGHAAGLYETLFERARGAGHDQVLCEVNLDPPNPGSDAFHARMGFGEIGRAVLPGGKVVRYLRRPLPEAAGGQAAATPS